jgi:predicted nucleic-acid-binding protein
MRAIDTNVLVRLLARDDAKQVAAAERFVEVGAWVSHLVLMEAAWELDSVYDLAPAAIATAMEMLLVHKNLTLEKTEVVAAAIAQFRKRPTLGFWTVSSSRSRAKPGTSPWVRSIGNWESSTTCRDFEGLIFR